MAAPRTRDGSFTGVWETLLGIERFLSRLFPQTCEDASDFRQDRDLTSEGRVFCPVGRASLL